MVNHYMKNLQEMAKAQRPFVTSFQIKSIFSEIEVMMRFGD